MTQVKRTIELPDFARTSRLLSIDQTRTLLNISRTQFYRIRKQGELQVYRIGRKPQCRYDEIMWYLEKHKE